MKLVTPMPFNSLKEIRFNEKLKHYALLEQVGEGGQGSVWSAVDRQNDQIVAIKFSELPDSREKKSSEDVLLERQIGQLARLRHPYILPMFDYGILNRLRYIVTPYIPGGSLENLVGAGPIALPKVIQYAAKISAALAHLHAQGIIHRDLKPSNILLDLHHNIYLSDFGLARVLSNSTQAMHTGRGTPYYASPEQHTMSEALLQSDIYSFGVVLYEMLTGQLPWHGEKMLGIQQLQAREELPDPCELNPSLPREITPVLRKITATLPEARPETIQQAMQLLYQASGCAPVPLESAEDWREERIKNLNAFEIYEKSRRHWNSPGSTLPLSLTAFALIDTSPHAEQAIAKSPQFALNSALSYGYKHEDWWRKTTSLSDRLAVAAGLLATDSEEIRARVTALLVHDSELAGQKIQPQSALVKSILQSIGLTQQAGTRHDLLALLNQILEPGRAWQSVFLGEEEDALLAYQSLEDSPTGDQAAQLIGHLRAETALKTAFKTVAPQRRLHLLLVVLQNAGSLPGSIPFQPRQEAYLEWIFAQAFAAPFRLGLLLLASLFGAGLGFGVYTYAVYRLNIFLDTARFLTAVQHGLFLGVGFALLVPLARIIIERFPKSSTWQRVLAATLLGSLPLTSIILLYHTLLLERYEILQAVNLPKTAFLLSACLLIAGGFSLASLARSRWLKMLFYALGVFLPLFGSWWAHLNFALHPFPVLYYEYTWPLSQVFVLSAFTAISTALGAGLLDINLSDFQPAGPPNRQSASNQ